MIIDIYTYVDHLVLRMNFIMDQLLQKEMFEKEDELGHYVWAMKTYNIYSY